MAKYSFVVALGLCMSASAIKCMEPKDFDDQNISVGEACKKVLTTDIHCDKYIAEFTDTSYFRGDSDEDLEMADTICKNPCSDSFQSWYQKLRKECAEEEFLSDYYPTNYFIYFGDNVSSGLNQTCAKDPKTGRYCGEILNEFPEIEDDEEMPLEELCHPCYVKLINMRSTSNAWPTLATPAGDYWHKQLKLVREKCSGSGSKKDASSMDGKETAGEDTTSVTPHKTASADGSGVSTIPAAITTSTATAVSESAAPENNAGDAMENKHIRTYWYAMLVLGMRVVIF